VTHYFVEEIQVLGRIDGSPQTVVLSKKPIRVEFEDGDSLDIDWHLDFQS
jgi:hypothetical protein